MVPAGASVQERASPCISALAIARPARGMPPQHAGSEHAASRRLSRLEVGRAEGGAPGLAGDGLLREEARGGDHRHAAVHELLGLHLAELGRILRREAQRVEADLAGHVARAERGLGLELLAVMTAQSHTGSCGIWSMAGPPSAEKSGWNFSCTRKPSDASMPTRPCVSSHSRYRFTSSSDLPSRKPAGSQLSSPPPSALKLPGRPYANAGFAGVAAFLPKPPNCICGDTLEAPTAEPAKAVVWIEAMESMIVLVVV